MTLSDLPDPGLPVRRNLVALLFQQVRRFKGRPVLWRKSGSQYRSISWAELGRSIEVLAAGLSALGVQKGDRVALLSENRPEWVMADMAVMALGAVLVPLYPTAAPAEIGHILCDSGPVILIVSTEKHRSRIDALSGQSSSVRTVILIDPPDSPGAGLQSFESLRELGRQALRKDPGFFHRAVGAVGPQDVATLIYTSGTTGTSKGVMLTHENFISNFEGCRARIRMTPDDLTLSFLPLSHVFERLAGYYFMLFSGASIGYAESLDSVADDMRSLRPTAAPAVPRFYEKVHGRILERVRALSPARQKFFHWAIRTGGVLRKKRMAPQRLTLREAAALAAADFLVHRKIRGIFGGRLRFFISGGAPLPIEMAEFYFSCGVLILEGYGLTETSPVIAVNGEDDFVFGTVGRPLENCEVRLAEDGEILLRAPSVMKGYYRNEAATAEVMRDGYFCTGDIGELDARGYLKITDRKKDIIKTSGGKMIAPQKIEKVLLADPLYAQAVVLGDRRQYLVALLVPRKEALKRLASPWNLGDLSWEDLVRHPRVFEFYHKDLELKMKSFASYEQIKYFALLAEEFTVEAGELTATQKIRRRVIQEKYQALLDPLYREHPLRPPESAP